MCIGVSANRKSGTLFGRISWVVSADRQRFDLACGQTPILRYDGDEGTCSGWESQTVSDEWDVWLVSAAELIAGFACWADT